MCCSTYGCCIFIPLLAIFPIFCAILEILAGIRIHKGDPLPSAQGIAIFSIIVSLLSFNIISLTMEIIALAQFQDPEIKEYLFR